VSHVFTHFRLELAVVASDIPVGDGWWQSIDTVVDAGLPTLYRRAVESVLESRSALAA
jgi:A/G-specific adenine glycosylase